MNYLPATPMGKLAPLPRLDGLGRYNRAMRAELARMGLPEDAARQWASALAKMAHGYRLPFGLKSMGRKDVPDVLRDLLVVDATGWMLSQAGRAWLERVRANG